MPPITRSLVTGLFALTILAGGCGGDVPAAPVITSQPSDVAAYVGTWVTFTVAATGESLSYQWQVSLDAGATWLPLAGEEWDFYLLGGVEQGDFGLQFRCVVSNPGGAATSDTAALISRIVYVHPGATSGANDGSTWVNAFLDLQNALAAATAGQEIWVAADTYYPTQGTDRSVTFQLKDGVALYAGFAGDENELAERDFVTNVTTLSGDIGLAASALDNSYHVVTGADGATVDGFTVTAGNADGTGTNGHGGGMFLNFGDPTVTNCTFDGNMANYGGGILVDESNPIITNCTFDGNAAGVGGGMYIDDSNYPIVASCRFSGNSSLIVAGSGGGMIVHSSGGSITDCTFDGNTAWYGGGMSIIFNSPTVTGCTFYGNTATDSGGGMRVHGSTAIVASCTLGGNSANEGGGMSLSMGSPTITNCLLWGNAAAISGSEINNSESTPTIDYSCIWDGLSGIGCAGDALPVGIGNIGDLPAHDPLFVNVPDFVDLTTVAGTTTTVVVVDNTIFSPGDEIEVGGDGVAREVTGVETDNITVTFAGDPLGAVSTIFAHVSNWGFGATDLTFDVRLSAGSGCIDVGDDASLPADTADVDSDGDTAEPLPLDLDGNPRISGSFVDMGAYEFQ
jgi:parallel beta-helix repeat protein